MPFICLTRTDVPPATLQVLDLRPNESQRNLIYEPPGQTKYVSFRPGNDVVGVYQPGGGGTPIMTLDAYEGLAAYLIDQIADASAANAALTAVKANTIATNIITNILNAGVAATLANINAQIAAVAAGSGIGVAPSTATLAGFLRILAGDQYNLPALSVVDTDGATFNPVISGTFVTRIRHTYNSGSLNISMGAGHLSEFTSPTFRYRGTAGRAVIVYDDDGTILA